MSAKIISPELPMELPAHKTLSVFGHPRDFLDNRFIYLLISPRARGLCIGVNMNPDKFCNFDCVYCEVNRDVPPSDRDLDIGVMAAELDKTLFMVSSGEICHRLPYGRLNSELLKLRHVVLSGDGEPTLCKDFCGAVQAVVHMRARRTHPYFKLVLMTNGTALDSPPVLDGLRYFTRDDEVWIKLDAGTQDYMDKVNASEVALDKVVQNALHLGRRRPIVIQSLFALIHGEEPSPDEISQYIQRLNDLKTGGAQISMVQIYSATRPAKHTDWGHLPLKSLSLICRRVRTETSLKVEIF